MVQTNAEVTKILVENNRVRGVLVEAGEKELPGEIRKGYVLEAPLVVAAFPIWDLFKVTSKGLYPPWFVERVEMLNRTTAFFGIQAGCKEPLFEEKWWVLMESPRTRYPFAAYMETNVCPQLAPEGEHLFNCCYLAEPELNKVEQREHLHELFELARQDLEELFPGWEDKCLWIKPFFHEFEEPARTPGRAGVFRPGPKAPLIEGLYFAGDTVNARALPGLECAAASAMQCADAILEVL
jgi:phytoene dehydrogenase-like protein